LAEREAEICVYEAADGYPLHYRRWAPAGRTRGRVVYLHGIQSHGGWYERSSRRLGDEGFEVLFPDRRGSGLNQPDRGHADNGGQLLDDLHRLIAPLRHSVPAVPVLLLAVSWGGKLAVAFARRHPECIDGLGLLDPGLFPRIRPRPDQRLLLGLLGRLGFKRLSARIPLDDPAWFTDVTCYQEFIAADPLALHRVTVGFLLASRELDRCIEDAGGEIRIPLLLMLAGRDRIVDNVHTREFFEKLPGAPKKRIEYPDAAHTLEFQAEPGPFLQDLVEWARATSQQSLLRARAAAASP
jgi:alpha-beta hydrolase superfamily lysophospholipase